jgi:hypothetical protein
VCILDHGHIVSFPYHSMYRTVIWPRVNCRAEQCYGPNMRVSHISLTWINLKTENYWHSAGHGFDSCLAQYCFGHAPLGILWQDGCDWLGLGRQLSGFWLQSMLGVSVHGESMALDSTIDWLISPLWSVSMERVSLCGCKETYLIMPLLPQALLIRENPWLDLKPMTTCQATERIQYENTFQLARTTAGHGYTFGMDYQHLSWRILWITCHW